MRSILAVFALAIVYVVADNNLLDILPDASWAKLISTSTGGELLHANDDTTCNAIYSCQDCHTARVCRPTTSGTFELLQTIPCSGSRPFCEPNSGSCVAEEPDTCGDQDNFVCLGNGKYPDANCSRFHACLDLQSLTFACSGDKTYNARSQICEAGSECGTFDCAGNEGSKVPHSAYSGYYAFCHNNNGPLVVDSCPGNYELNSTSQLCEPVCHAEGIVVDVSDCHYYFKCTKIIIRPDLDYFQRDRLKCPDGQAYSPRDYLCVADTNVETCQKP